jgi:HrpA-like RNA helicase
MVRDIPPLVVCPLYAALPSHQQLKVFNETPQVIANCVKSK